MTGAARAQAGRRWCLSGTPIQNAVDELYAYFRFLQYQPYARQAAFKAMLKEPLASNAELGARRLRAALQARRSCLPQPSSSALLPAQRGHQEPRGRRNP